MSAETISRETASRINPIISGIFTEDTLCSASEMLKSMGWLLMQADKHSEEAGITFGNLYLFCNTIAAAIDYEKENPRLCGFGAAKQGAAS